MKPRSQEEFKEAARSYQNVILGMISYLLMFPWFLSNNFSETSYRETAVCLQRPSGRLEGLLHFLHEAGQDSEAEEDGRQPGREEESGGDHDSTEDRSAQLAWVCFLHPEDQHKAGRGLRYLQYLCLIMTNVRTSTGASTPPTAPPASLTSPTSSTWRTRRRRTWCSASQAWRTWWAATSWGTPPRAGTPRLWWRWSEDKVYLCLLTD